LEAISGTSRDYGAGLIAAPPRIAARPAAAPGRTDRPRPMSEPRTPRERPRSRWRRGHTAAAATLVLLAAAVAFGLSSLDLPRIGESLVGATPGWIVAAIALMATSLVLRSVSWHQTLRAALPDTPMPWPPVVRALMIGVMASA